LGADAFHAQSQMQKCIRTKNIETWKPEGTVEVWEGKTLGVEGGEWGPSHITTHHSKAKKRTGRATPEQRLDLKAWKGHFEEGRRGMRERTPERSGLGNYRRKDASVFRSRLPGR